MSKTQIGTSEESGDEMQAVANLCKFLLKREETIPTDTDEVIKLMLKHRPRGVPQDKAGKIRLSNQRANWIHAFQGCKALKRGWFTVKDVII